MSNALAVLDAAPQFLGEVAGMFEGTEGNLAPKATVPSLSYKGKVWAITLNGEETKLEKKNADGDTEPLSVMRVVLLDYAKRRGRSYYPGAYDPEKVAMPECWSDDGVTPSANVKEPKSSKCDGCEMSKKGSKITDNGKSVTACSQHRMLAVLPSYNLDFAPLRLKLAVTSDYDGQSPDHEAAGWYGLQQYTDLLRARQVPHTCMLVTKMKFDPNVAYPKVMFAVDKWLTKEQIEKVAPIAKSPEVAALIAGGWQPNGTDAEKVEATGDAETAKPAAAAVAAAKKAADVEAARKAAEKKAADEAAAAAKKAAADDDDEGEVVMTTAAPKTATTAPKATAAAATKKADPKKVEAKPATVAKSNGFDAPGVKVAGDEPAADADNGLGDLLAQWE
jgi:hypothetical protein